MTRYTLSATSPSTTCIHHIQRVQSAYVTLRCLQVNRDAVSHRSEMWLLVARVVGAITVSKCTEAMRPHNRVKLYKLVQINYKLQMKLYKLVLKTSGLDLMCPQKLIQAILTFITSQSYSPKQICCSATPLLLCKRKFLETHANNL